VKKNVLKEYDITVGGVKSLNKISIEDWAPKDKVEDEAQKESKKKKKTPVQTDKED
jgi:hypothetical protein